jgi:myo-inositol-1(or 4)-monophosphatase
MPTPDLDALLTLAREVALEAGALLRERAPLARSLVASKSTLVDMVTDADHASDSLIVGRIRDARPDDAILCEESGAKEGTSGVRWLIDPLDGTTNFLYGIPAYAVSIGIEVDGERVAGVVHDAGRKETFWARRDGGAFLDGLPVTVSGAEVLASALVGTGFSYTAAFRERQAELLTRLIPHVRDIRRGGAASIDLCWVACGRLDAFFERDLGGLWDIAAGEAIAREAGARTAALSGTPEGSQAILAATPALFEALRALVEEAEGRSLG